MNVEGPRQTICLVNGSLRGEKASSLRFLRDVDRLLGDDEYRKHFITVKARFRGSYPEAVLGAMRDADALVFVFPLFGYSLPGALTRLLEDCHRDRKEGGGRGRASKVYAIVNCAFAEPQINGEAIRVLKNFCRRLGLRWRFAVSIGCGPVAVLTEKIPLLRRRVRRAFAAIAADLRGDGSGERDTILVKPFISKTFLLAMRDWMEKRNRGRRERALSRQAPPPSPASHNPSGGRLT